MDSSCAKPLPRFIREKLKGSLTLQKILSNTGWLMGDQIVRHLVGLLVGVWLARYLGPHLFGEISYAFAVVMIVSPLVVLGLDEIAIRRMVQDPSCRNEVLGTSFFMMLGGGLIAFLLAMAMIFVARPGDHLIHWLVGILAAGSLVQAFIAIEFWFESQVQWKFAAFAKTSAFLLVSLIKVGLILSKASIVAFAWAGLGEAVLGAAGLIVVYRWRGHAITSWRFRWGTVNSLLRDTWPLIFSTALMMLYLRIDQVMLGNMVGSEELGNYSVAVRISEVWNFIPIAICSSVFPAILEAHRTSEELFYAHLQKLYNLMAFLAYGVALPIALFSTQIIQVLFSSSYADAAPLLAILVWTGVFTSLGAARNVFIISKNWTRVNLVTMALGCLINVILNLLLIPEHGAMGAVIATFFSYWFAVHGTCFLFKSLRNTGWMLTRAMVYPKLW